jgi:hypothetical protein
MSDKVARCILYVVHLSATKQAYESRGHAAYQCACHSI